MKGLLCVGGPRAHHALLVDRPYPHANFRPYGVLVIIKAKFHTYAKGRFSCCSQAIDQDLGSILSFLLLFSFSFRSHLIVWHSDVSLIMMII